MTKRDERFPAKYPVICRKGPEMFPATICNISLGGGCLLGADAIAKGDTVVLDYGNGQTRATAVWKMARMTGMKFDSRLSNFSLQSIRAMRTEA